MNRVIRIVLVLILALSIMLCTSGYTYRNDTVVSSDKVRLINEALSEIAPYKDSFECAEIDFEKLKVGAPISAYVLQEEGLMFSRNVYPLFQDNELVFLGFEVNTGDDTYIQITQGLVDKINATADFDTAYSLIYDNENCYLCGEDEVLLLAESEVQNPERPSLGNAPKAAAITSAKQTRIVPQMSLGYTPPAAVLSNTPSYYSCSVSWVTQQPYNKICWAATIACIVNYVKGNDLTAVEVAQSWFNSTDPEVFNEGESYVTALLCMDIEYNLHYNEIATAPSDSTMLYNIQNDYPVYGSFVSSTGKRHALTIYGINITGGYIAVMDPMNGPLRANYSASTSKYQYVSPSSGNVFSLSGGGSCY